MAESGFSVSLILEPGCYRTVPSACNGGCVMGVMCGFKQLRFWGCLLYYCSTTLSMVINAFPHSDVAITGCSFREIGRNPLLTSGTLANTIQVEA